MFQICFYLRNKSVFVLLVPFSFRFKTQNTDFRYDGIVLASRDCEKVLVWDLRAQGTLSEVHSAVHRKMDTCVNPEDKTFLIPGANGCLFILDRNNLRVEEKKLFDCEINRIIFHPRLYQLLTARSDGFVSIYYDKEKSVKGAMIGFKQTKKRREKGLFSNEPILNPLALPIFRQEKVRNLFVHRVREQNNESRKRRPELPISGAGEGGRIGHHGGTLSSYIVKNIALQHVSDTKEDPREALLKYAEDAEKNPFWITPAYKQTQPNPIFSTAEESVHEQKMNDTDAKKSKL